MTTLSTKYDYDILCGVSKPISNSGNPNYADAADVFSNNTSFSYPAASLKFYKSKEGVLYCITKVGDCLKIVPVYEDHVREDYAEVLLSEVENEAF